MKRITDLDKETIRTAIAAHPSASSDPFAFNRICTHLHNGLITMKDVREGAFS